MSEHTVTKAVSARVLKVLNKSAEEKGYNRQIADDALDRLDPTGWNILYPVMLHEHAQGKVVDPHIRAKVLMKWEGITEPQPVMLDISMDAWDILPDAQKLADTLAPKS